MDSSDTPSDQKRRALLAAFDEAAAPNGFALDGYDIIGELDRGGMAVVYHARQKNPEREVALKVMLPKYSEEREMRARFQIEARAMATLEHPAIMPIYEVGESDRLPFFSMKLAEGGSLAELIKNIPPTIQQTVSWMLEIAGAVHFAHQRGVLHRDLKPGNFLFDAHGQIYVSDFGVAKMLLGEDGVHTRTEAFVGTPNYMPPELAGGMAMEASVVSDLYSLGAVLYECFTGERPHASHTNVATLLRAIVDKPIPSPRTKNPEIPLDLDVICHKALEQDPSARYSSVAEFRDELQRWQEGKAILARPLSRPKRIGRWIKRHPLPASLLATIVLLTTIASIWIIVQNYTRGGLIHEGLLKEVYFERLVATPGFRERGFQNLRKASSYRESPKIRNHAIALLAKTDFIRTANHPPKAPLPSFLNPKDIRTTTSSTDQKWLISHHETGEAILWNTITGSQIHRWTPSVGQVVQADFAKGGILVVGAEGHSDPANSPNLQVRVTLHSGPSFKRFKEIHFPKEESFLLFSVSPSKDLVAFGGKDGLQVLDLNHQKFLWSSARGVARCRPAWSHDGNQVACALGDENTITIFDTFNHLRSVDYSAKRWVQNLAFHPQGRLLAATRSDQVLSLIDIFEKKLVVELPLSRNPIGPIQFSSDGRQFWDQNQDSETWTLQPPVGYREWSRASVKNRNSTVFESRLSPNGLWLLTVSGEGLKTWDVKAGCQIAFHGSENQRIDVQSSAWWLNDDEILFQVPGGLEVIRRDEREKLIFDRRVQRSPGSRVIDVKDDGAWLIEQLDDEGLHSLSLWPDGKMGEAIPLPTQNQDPKKLHQITNTSGQLIAQVLGPGLIKWHKAEPLTLTAPEPLEIHQILITQDEEKLIAISQSGRILEWNFPLLKAELERLGFEN